MPFAQELPRTGGRGEPPLPRTAPAYVPEASNPLDLRPSAYVETLATRPPLGRGLTQNGGCGKGGGSNGIFSRISHTSPLAGEV